MARLRGQGKPCPDRAADLLAALEAVAALGLEYAGTVRDSRGHPCCDVLTPASLAALVAACDRVAGLDRAPCTSPERQRENKNHCGACSLAHLAGYRWMLANEAALAPAARQALSLARFAEWPARFVREWESWRARLPGGGDG